MSGKVEIITASEDARKAANNTSDLNERWRLRKETERSQIAPIIYISEDPSKISYLPTSIEDARILKSALAARISEVHTELHRLESGAYSPADRIRRKENLVELEKEKEEVGKRLRVAKLYVHFWSQADKREVLGVIREEAGPYLLSLIQERDDLMQNLKRNKVGPDDERWEQVSSLRTMIRNGVMDLDCYPPKDKYP